MRNVTPAKAHAKRRPFTLRLWLPVSIPLLLLAPFAALALPVLWLVAPLGRRNWAPALFSIGAVLMALHGTRVEVRASHLNLSLELF
jgi:hypothetical protein